MQHQNPQTVTMSIFRRDDQTFDTEGKSGDFNWSYYVTAYVMRDWTEGVPSEIRWPFLRRNLPKDPETEEDFDKVFLPYVGEEALEIRISPNSYRLLYEIGTTDWWVHNKKVRVRGEKGMSAAAKERRKRFTGKFIEKPKWAENMTADAVEKVKAEYNKLAQKEGEDEVENEQEGVVAPTASAAALVEVVASDATANTAAAAAADAADAPPAPPGQDQAEEKQDAEMADV